MTKKTKMKTHSREWKVKQTFKLGQMAHLGLLRKSNQPLDMFFYIDKKLRGYHHEKG